MHWKKAFDETNLFSKLNLQHFKYVQVGDVETIVDRVGSISFISALSKEDKSRVLRQVRELVATQPETRDSLEIRLPYRTDVYWCEKEF